MAGQSAHTPQWLNSITSRLWRWLLSKFSKCQLSQTTFPLRAPLNLMISVHEGMSLLGSHHFQFYCSPFMHMVLTYFFRLLMNQRFQTTTHLTVTLIQWQPLITWECPGLWFTRIGHLNLIKKPTLLAFSAIVLQEEHKTQMWVTGIIILSFLQEYCRLN